MKQFTSNFAEILCAPVPRTTQCLANEMKIKRQIDFVLSKSA